MKYLRWILLYYCLTWSISAFAQDIRDVKSPVDFPPNYLSLILILAVIVILVLVFFFKYLRNKLKRKEAPAQKIKTPWEIALEEIESLLRGTLLKNEQYNEFFDQLSDIVRRYFEGRFSIRAPEMTTEEVLASLKSYQVLSREQEEILQEFLVSCDLVKFADHIPQNQEIEQCVQLATTLIHQTKGNSNPAVS